MGRPLTEEELNQFNTPGPVGAVTSPPLGVDAPRSRPFDPAVDTMAPLETTAPEQPMSWGDWARAAMTAGVRGIARASDTLPDPASTARRLAFPDFQPANWIGDQVFKQTGVEEYKPTTPSGRVAMEGATSGVAGLPMGGPVAGLYGTASGVASQIAREGGLSERAASLIGMIPGAVGGTLGARARSQAPPEIEAWGTNPTFGQAMGGWANRLEQGLGSFPFLGDFMRGGRTGATEQFNRGNINRALSFAGEELPARTPLGRDAVAEADTILGDRYNAITPRINNVPLPTTDQLNNPQAGPAPPPGTPGFHGGMQGVMRDLSMAGPAIVDRFNNIYDRLITDPLNRSGGSLSGEQFRNAESQLGDQARNFRNSGDPDQRTLGIALTRLQSGLRAELRAQNPHLAEELQGIHRAYAEMLPIDVAAGRLGTGLGGQSQMGVVTPRQLTAGVQSLDPTLRHRGFRQGTATGQQYAEPGINYLGDTVPDSGTPYRAAAGIGAEALAGGGATALGYLDPITLAKYGGLAALGASMYSAPGRAAMNYFLRRPEQMMAPGLIAAQNQFTTGRGGLLGP